MKIRDRIKELRRVKASELLPNPKNWRTHPEEQQNAMRGILAEVGIADAVLARETEHGLMLIDGHLRADVSPDTKWPVLVLDVTEEEADKLLATVDPIAGMAGRDDEKLTELLAEIDSESEALAELLADMKPSQPAEIVEDEVPDPPKKAVTKAGDVWLLGKHRLLCGDSLAGYRHLQGASFCLTDPPYSVGYSVSFSKAEGGKDLGNQARYHEMETPEWMSILPELPPILIMTFPVDRHFYLLAKGLSGGQYAEIRECVWVKQKATFHPGARFRQQHEPVILCRRKSTSLPSGQRSTVIECEVPTAHSDHPTEKPQKLWCELMSWYEGDVCDPFLGSGTTMIAAEQLGRRCYCIEIDPIYCDVAVERWQNMTGEKAKRECQKSKNGRASSKTSSTSSKKRQPRKKSTAGSS